MRESLEKKKDPLSRGEKAILKELGPHTLTMLNELRDDIEKGSYSMVLGDDASGRIPALMVWNVLKEVYTRRGLTPPVMRYIAGSAGRYLDLREGQEKLHERMSQLESTFPTTEDKLPGKVLIVTDTINTGRSLFAILDSLVARGIHFDIASIGVMNLEVTGVMEKKYGCKVVYGISGGDATPKIYQAPLSGVRKDRGFDAIARKDSYADQSKVNAVRKYLKEKIVPALIKEYESTK